MRRIDGVNYHTASEVLKATGIARQTLYRWRKEGRVPQGHRLRGRLLLFTESDYAAILAHANRIDPSLPETDPAQIALPLRKNGDGSP